MHDLAGIRRINADFAARATPVQQAPEPVLTNPAPLGVDLRVIQKSDRTHIFPVTLKGAIFCEGEAKLPASTTRVGMSYSVPATDAERALSALSGSGLAIELIA